MEGIAPGINMRRLVEKCSPQTTELSVKHSTSVEKQNEMGVLLKKNHRDCTIAAKILWLSLFDTSNVNQVLMSERQCQTLIFPKTNIYL
jgi:hypothetical protein